ncbi:MAG: glycosyltransferase family 4 protein [Methanolobus sp.]|uniref:glycosyltransferase family 4 protein n=1 Tax=Methanolobus sp. TaxID=1874737 RepID=UPI0027300931|nr:glycosyltransferase family 4 protein [Methanolobus sp.]MDP2218008.1 glycosyltransferase family 4 protein [Methanolobus sp.]
MKILQIAALYPPHVGGIENHVYQLSNYLSKRGHEVTVYTSTSLNSIKYDICNGVKIHRFESILSPLNNQIVPEILFRLLKNNNFDVIHAHGHLQMTTNFAAISRLKTKLPLVITSHGTVLYDDWKEHLNIIYKETVGKWTLLSANCVIALSPSQATILKEYGIKNIKVIPNGITIDQINEKIDCSEFKTLFGLENKTIILYVGSLIPRKGVEYLVDAMKEIKEDSILVVVGDVLKGNQDYKDKLLEIMQSQNIQNIVFTGRIDSTLLNQAYGAADIFVLPSLSEGLPTVLLEAMAYKKAIIASDIPGNSDLIKNHYTGILVEPRSSKKIAEEIKNLIHKHGEREILGVNAYNAVTTEYVWDSIVEKIESVYKHLL